MITNNFNKELRGISDALRDLGYTDSTIGMRQRYSKNFSQKSHAVGRIPALSIRWHCILV